MSFADGGCPVGGLFCGDTEERFWDEPPPVVDQQMMPSKRQQLAAQLQSFSRWIKGETANAATAPLAANLHDHHHPNAAAAAAADAEFQKRTSEEETVASSSSSPEVAMGYMEFDSDNGSQQDGENHKTTSTSEKGETKTLPWTAYLMLASTIVGNSSVGPLLSFQDEGGVTFKILWRSSAFALSLIPFCVVSARQDGLPSLSWEYVGLLVLSGVSYGCLAILFSWSLCYTTVGNAVVFSNTQSLILLIGGGLMGQKISMSE